MKFRIVNHGIIGSYTDNKYYIKYGFFVVAEFFLPVSYSKEFDALMREKGLME